MGFLKTLTETKPYFKAMILRRPVKFKKGKDKKQYLIQRIGMDGEIDLYCPIEQEVTQHDVDNNKLKIIWE